MLAKNKIAVLRVAMVRLSLSEKDYRAILENYGGVHTARDLDESGFAVVMDRFRALGFTSSARERSFGDRDGMATPGQVAAIRKLWDRWADAPTEAGLNGFLERQAKVSSLRFLPANKTSAVITALKAMVQKKTSHHAA